MMKVLPTLLTVGLLSTPAAAVSLQIGEGTTTGGLAFNTFTLAPEELNDGFDTIETIITATAGTFLTDGDTAASLINVGDDETSFSAFLTAPPVFGGRGLSEFGYTEEAALLSGTYASLGNNSAAAGNSLLAQVAFAPSAASFNGGSVLINLFDNGNLVGSLNENFGTVPEPASVALLAAGGVALLRRRREA